MSENLVKPPGRQMNSLYPCGFEKNAEVIQVIRTGLDMKGDGKENPYRRIIQYWTLDGKLLCEVDPAARIVRPEDK